MTRSAQILAALVLLVVSAVFTGYVTHVPLLITVMPSLQGMSVVTALGIGCVALAFFVPRGAAFVVCWAALLAAIAALASHAVLGRDAFSPYLAHVFFGTPFGESGHTSVATAIAIALIGFAQHQRLLRRHLLADVLASTALLLSSTALLGYAYGVSDLYALFLFNTMAVHTAAALFALGLATVFAQANRGWARTIASSRPGGGATRRQLAFTLLPPVAGGLLLESTHVGRLGPGVAMALLVVITIAPLIALILHDGRTLDALDIERESSDRLKEQTAHELKVRLAEQAAALNRESAERAKAESAMYDAQRLEAVGQLTGGIAHDFNNLLMGISGNLHLTQSRLGVEHPARTFVDNAAAATQRGTKLTGQLLAFSRTQRLDIRPIELDAVVQDARALFGNALGPKIAIDIELLAPGAWILADADQLHLAILNLALNARDAMPAGGAFSIRTLVGPVSGDDTRGSSFATIRVSDSGMGMAAEVVDRAVEPFFTTKERGKGTGLGLAQVYGVVKQCGGDLRIRSTLGSGTTIDLRLPLTAARTAAVPSVPKSEETSVPVTSRTGPLLVIDDDEDVRVALAEMFRSAGYEVSEAESGAAGLRMLDEITPVLAVIDFIMPDLNGAEVARLARVKLPSLPIIFVSGYADTLALDEIGNATILRKPVGPEALLSAVDNALRAA
ncbi:ATP-binding protein [Burkholderia sp. S171]|uniref:ATP-binding protein n=1 Tax=Burkholderia sp. S171 TaxID=1641860 RepID=UPI00131ADFEA|nr:ATP-binding protein [Burkholderia sp. S171]